jgi:hypothetical protein
VQKLPHIVVEILLKLKTSVGYAVVELGWSIFEESNAFYEGKSILMA